MLKPSYVSACVLLAIFTFSADAETHFKATTTLTAETANNTSAADTFVGQPNGNVTAGNVSKVPIRTLLYSGATSRIYSHLMPWFGFGNHVDVGYVSNDLLQVRKQVDDMISRGLDGVIIDWYGRGDGKREYPYYDQASQEVMHEAESHPGFTFALMEDAGSLNYCGRPHCDVTGSLIEDLNYAERIYEHSSAYLHYKNRPVVFFFGDSAYNIDWRRVRSKAAGNPIFVFRNAGGFTHPEAEGAFSWVSPIKAHSDVKLSQDRMGLSYLDNFYRTATAHHDSYAVATGYKGFNDSIALWDANRIMGQQCGQIWLKSVADINAQFSVDNQISAIQLVTWNDYEEGTEFESGVDNCLDVSASAHNTSIFWRVNGDTSTVDHFMIFVSQDGDNLMPVADLAPEQTSLDLASFGLEAGKYVVFVKAVAKPSLTNRMSKGQEVTIPSGPSVGPSAALNISAVPAPSKAEVSADESSHSNASSGMQGIRGIEDVTATLQSLDGQPLSSSSTIDFGDGTVSVGQTTVSHVYRLDGTYTIMATTTDVKGNTSSFTSQITVISKSADE
jgi:hypothetical protein